MLWLHKDADFCLPFPGCSTWRSPKAHWSCPARDPARILSYARVSRTNPGDTIQFARSLPKDRDVENHTVGRNSKLLKVRDSINITREKKSFSGREVQKIHSRQQNNKKERKILLSEPNNCSKQGHWVACITAFTSALCTFTQANNSITEGEGRGTIIINKTLILFTSILRRSNLTLSISAPNKEQNALTQKSTALVLAFFTLYLIQHPLTGEAGAIAQGTAALVTAKIDCFSYAVLINII